MSDYTLNLTPNVYHYLQDISLREPAVLEQLRKETHNLSNAMMQISPEQGQLMSLLVELINAKKTIDIGTFTGYSALVVALSLPPDGIVITCDVDPNYTAIAQDFWKRANVDHKIHLHLAPAVETLNNLLEKGEENTFDFIFIDADKNNYPTYYEKSLALLRSGGLMAIDNVLWSGQVADKSIDDSITRTLRKLNETIKKDNRVSISMIPIGDGLTLARKR